MDGQANTEPIRLLLLDDHVLFREGLSRLLASEPDFEMVGNCGCTIEIVAVDVVPLSLATETVSGNAFCPFGTCLFRSRIAATSNVAVL